MAELDPLAVYIHWPYCTRICPYCDFNVYKTKGNDGALLSSIIRDLEGWRKDSGPRYITSIHFGGGTPSLLSAEDIKILIDKVDALWGLLSETEIALEANPIDADPVKWTAYKNNGINRLSLGVQTFDSKALKFLGRDHSGEQALGALTLAKSIFPSVSADIIFGWAGQTQAQLDHDIKTVLSANTDHISTYQLTIENGTAFAKAEERGQSRAVNEDASADFFEAVTTSLLDAGFDHYEVSNFAKPNHSSRHNLAYWKAFDYVGVGPGAHGRLTIGEQKQAMVCELTPAAYINCVEKNARGYSAKDLLSPSERAEEYVLMGLRITEGFSLDHYKHITGNELEPERYKPLISDGLLALHKRKLSATPQGRFVLNALTDALLV